MHQRSNSYTKGLVPLKKEGFTFTILNPEKRLQEKQAQIIVKSQDEVHFVGINQPFTFSNENKIQIQVIVNNKMFGSISFKPKIINKIPASATKWITLFDPNDDFYDGDFAEDDAEEPRVYISFNRVQQQEEKSSQEQSVNHQVCEKQYDNNGALSSRSQVLKENNGEAKTNRGSSKDSSNIASQQNLKNVFRQSFNMKLVNEDLNDQIHNKDEFIKKLSEKLHSQQVKLEFKEKENGVLSNNIQKVQLQLNGLQKQATEDEIKIHTLQKDLKKSETKITKLTDYLIDFKEKYFKLQEETEKNNIKIKDYEEKQINVENQDYYQEQLEKKRLIIESLRQQVQEFQQNETEQEQLLKQLQKEIQVQKLKASEIEELHNDQQKQYDDGKNSKIESLLEEVKTQKGQIESLSDQVKLILEDKEQLQAKLEEKESIIIKKGNEEKQFNEQIKKQQKEIDDQQLQIDEQSQHIKNQAKQINEQNQLILKHKQSFESQKDKLEKENAQRNQLINENKKVTQMFLEQKQKLIECVNENKKLQAIVKDYEQKINSYEQKLKLLTEQQWQSQTNVVLEKEHIQKPGNTIQQFWQNIPNKIADLEKDMANYDQKHFILLESNSQQQLPINTPTIGMMESGQEQTSQQTDCYSGFGIQCQQPKPVTPFLHISNSNSTNQQFSKKEESNLPIQLGNYQQILTKQLNNNQISSSLFSSLSFSDDSLAFATSKTQIDNTKVNKQNLSLIKSESSAFQSLNNSVSKQKEKENSVLTLESEDLSKKDLSINEYRNKRYQLRISQPTFVSNQSTTKSLDSQNKIGVISTHVNQSLKSNQNSGAPSPVFKTTNTFIHLSNSGVKTDRSSSVSQYSDSKKGNSLSCSSSKKRSNTSLESKRWRI